MTLKKFKKLKKGDYVKVITPLFGYSRHLETNELETRSMGSWVGTIISIGKQGIAEVKFRTSLCAAAIGLNTYLQITRKVKKDPDFINKWKEKNDE